MKKLFYGDNLQILREQIADESVDLIYLDPPFNSKRDYNLLFKTPKGHESDAQITAFEDTWRWGPQAADEFRQLEQSRNTDVAEMMRALRAFIGENDMMAYLTMMANRLLEMHRVLKPTGSLYLHCDPTASHYLKIVLDGVFGKENFINEIVWKRSDAHSDGKQGARHLAAYTTFFFSIARIQTATDARLIRSIRHFQKAPLRIGTETLRRVRAAATTKPTHPARAAHRRETRITNGMASRVFGAITKLEWSRWRRPGNWSTPNLGSHTRSAT
jgi:DNA modification methylase